MCLIGVLTSGEGKLVSSKPVIWTVNPVFNETLLLAALDPDDRVLFRVKDYGMLSEETMGGVLGPRVVATGTCQMGCDFDGYLALQTGKEIQGNGPPVLRLQVRFSNLGQPMPEPTLGEVLPELVEGQAFWGTSPAEVLGSLAQTVAVSVFDKSGCGVLASSSQDIAPSAPAVPQAQYQPELEPAAGTSSPFMIDEAVFALCPLNLCVERVLDMQQKGVRFPFPAALGRNYNAVGFGYDRAVRAYATTWKHFDERYMPEDIDHVLLELTKLSEQREHPAWCSGVQVVQGFLRTVKAWRVHGAQRIRGPHDRASLVHVLSVSSSLCGCFRQRLG